MDYKSESLRSDLVVGGTTDITIVDKDSAQSSNHRPVNSFDDRDVIILETDCISSHNREVASANATRADDDVIILDDQSTNAVGSRDAQQQRIEHGREYNPARDELNIVRDDLVASQCVKSEHVPSSQGLLPSGGVQPSRVVQLLGGGQPPGSVRRSGGVQQPPNQSERTRDASVGTVNMGHSTVVECDAHMDDDCTITQPRILGPVIPAGFIKAAAAIRYPQVMDETGDDDCSVVVMDSAVDLTGGSERDATGPSDGAVSDPACGVGVGVSSRHDPVHKPNATENDPVRKTNTTENDPVHKTNAELNDPMQNTNAFDQDATSGVDADIRDDEMDCAEWKVEYDFNSALCLCTERDEFSRMAGNYLKGCKWSPDGSCLLTNSNDNTLRLFNLPPSLWSSDLTTTPALDVALRMAEGGLIYDYCWYPGMRSASPDTCCIACTSRGVPVHLWDAFTGQLRCAYRCYDDMDELASAKSVAFNRAGDKLYCGFEKMIRIFDTSRPGRECTNVSYKSTKKRQVRGQAGIMSTIAFHPDDTMFAVGTYAKSVGLYSAETNKCVTVLRGHDSGVTQVTFAPNGNHLFSGTRKNHEIFCWDIRHSRAPAYRVHRLVETNQRIQFDLEPSGRFLASGQHNGLLSVWDTEAPLQDQSDILQPLADIPAHNDTVNGVSFHPYLPLLSSASGQHHIKFTMALDSEGEDEMSDASVEENTVKLWWLGKPAP